MKCLRNVGPCGLAMPIMTLAIGFVLGVYFKNGQDEGVDILRHVRTL